MENKFLLDVLGNAFLLEIANNFTQKKNAIKVRFNDGTCTNIYIEKI